MSQMTTLDIDGVLRCLNTCVSMSNPLRNYMINNHVLDYLFLILRGTPIPPAPSPLTPSTLSVLFNFISGLLSFGDAAIAELSFRFPPSTTAAATGKNFAATPISPGHSTLPRHLVTHHSWHLAVLQHKLCAGVVVASRAASDYTRAVADTMIAILNTDRGLALILTDNSFRDALKWMIKNAVGTGNKALIMQVTFSPSLITPIACICACGHTQCSSRGWCSLALPSLVEFSLCCIHFVSQIVRHMTTVEAHAEIKFVHFIF